MSDKQKKKIPIPKEFTEQQFVPQTEMLQVSKKPSKLYIGIPKEITMQENRVALVPSSVATLIGHGHRVVVESGAGEESSYSDHDYSETGADIAYSAEQVYKADVIIKVAPPTQAEIELMHPNQILISPLQLPIINADYINKLRQKRVIALAMEYIKDESDTFPIVRIMSEMAGISAMLTAAELMATTSGGKGVLLGGISGVPSAKVVILGAGIVAEYATRTALGLGAEVRIFDNNIYKLKRLQNQVGRPLYTSAINPHYLEAELIYADVAIGAMHSKSGRTPVVVSEEMVMNVFTDFENESTEQIESCILSLNDGNYENILINLHTLKGNAGTLGIERVSNLVIEIEAKLKEKKKIYDTLADELNELKNKFEEFKDYYPTFLNN